MDNQVDIRHVDKRIRGAMAHLVLSLDFLTRAMLKKKNDQEASIAKAEQTLGKASQIIHELAWSVENQDEDNDRSRSRKKRKRSESVSLLNTSVTSELQETETDHSRESSFSRSSERVRPVVQKYLS